MNANLEHLDYYYMHAGRLLLLSCKAPSDKDPSLPRANFAHTKEGRRKFSEKLEYPKWIKPTSSSTQYEYRHFQCCVSS